MRPVFAGAAFAGLLLAAGPTFAQTEIRRIEAFAPAVGVEQLFDIEYRLEDVRGEGVTPVTGVNYRLAVTPIEKVADGYRLHILLSDVARHKAEAGAGMDMIVAAAMILESEAFEVLTDYRGVPQTVVDFANVSERLKGRADGIHDPVVSSIARSVVGFHDEHQLSSRIADPLVGAGLAFHYLLLAQDAPTPAVRWFTIAMTVTRAVDPFGGGVRVAYASDELAAPGGPPLRVGEGVIRPDGTVAELNDTRNRGVAGNLRRSVTTITAVTPP